jgi:hypothetical protein
MLINNRERAVSDDFNRLQSFARADLENALRRLLATRAGASSLPFLEAGSYTDTGAADVAAIGAPLVGDVFDGLIVQPQNGSLSLLVSPGEVGLDDPDGQTGSSDPTPASPDDSRYKLVADPGVQSPGVLTLAAGAVATRIDVVECRRKTIVTEQRNTDLYNTSSGLFTPGLVNKVTDEQLEYRVRQGTPGAGLPAPAQGWLPLAVASVPSTATSNDNITFWDVRPLVKDRINAPFEQQRAVAFTEGKRWLYANDHTDASKCTLSGVVTSAIGMYRAGGLFPAGPTAFDARAAANHAAGYSPGVGLPWFLYAVFPGGLPRWVRYIDAPAAPRTPVGPLGVLVVSEAGPAFDFGISDTCNPPTATGLVTPGPCALLAAGVVGTGPAEKGFIMQAGELLLDPVTPISAPSPVVASGIDKYTLSPNAHFPVTASAVLVRVEAAFTGGTSGTQESFAYSLVVFANDGTPLGTPRSDRLTVTYDVTGGADLAFTCWVPRAAFGSSNGEPDDSLRFQIQWANTRTRSSQTCVVLGWKL